MEVTVGEQQELEANHLMEKARKYRDLAAQCVLMASDEPNEGQKAVLLEIAQRWLYLAERVEGREYGTTNGDPDA